jgi:uncharacterized membrane protein YedE/YeeE
MKVEEIKIYKKFFLIFMIVCFIVSIISGFWIQRVYDIDYISKSLHVMTFFFLSIIFGILAILCELILKLNELEKRISELELLRSFYLRK